MDSAQANRERVAELRARGDDAEARRLLKESRLARQPASPPELDHGRTFSPEEGALLRGDPEAYEQWRRDLELTLLHGHEKANRARVRAHRLAFSQCRTCDELRKAATRPGH